MSTGRATLPALSHCISSSSALNFDALKKGVHVLITPKQVSCVHMSEQRLQKAQGDNCRQVQIIALFEKATDGLNARCLKVHLETPCNKRPQQTCCHGKQ